MATTYSWKVTSVKVMDEDSNKNAVVQTLWKKTGTDENGNTGEYSGAAPFTSKNVPQNDFIAFESLTEAKVIEWIQGAVSKGYEEHINQMIERQIVHKNGNNVKMPWDTSEPVTPPTPPAPAV